MWSVIIVDEIQLPSNVGGLGFPHLVRCSGCSFPESILGNYSVPLKRKLIHAVIKYPDFYAHKQDIWDLCPVATPRVLIEVS